MPANPPTLPPEVKRQMVAAHCAALVVLLDEMAARATEPIEEKRGQRGIPYESTVHQLAANTDRSLGPDGCWPWQLRRDDHGYGRIGVNGQSRLVHRVAWEIAFGAIPDGLYVCHRCDVRHCVNPDHLFLGTHKENMNDAITKGRIGKLTRADVAEIRSAFANGESARALAKRFSVHHSTVCEVVNEKTWKGETPTPNPQQSAAGVRPAAR